MTLHELKTQLQQQNTLAFELPDGSLVPSHFHITEVGRVTKNFIDCGGVTRKEEVISLQLWEANDYDHRLHPEKMLQIIEIGEKAFNLRDLEIEVEYQGNTIQKFGLDLKANHFVLINKKTACLALDACQIIPESNEKKTEKCTSGSGCC
jgi:hypothetical protein